MMRKSVSGSQLLVPSSFTSQSAVSASTSVLTDRDKHVVQHIVVAIVSGMFVPCKQCDLSFTHSFVYLPVYYSSSLRKPFLPPKEKSR